jgi:autotransporter-associated beta strand protein
MGFVKMIRASVFSSAIALAVLATLLSPNVGRANILLNGSFESPVVTPGTFLNISPGGEPAGFDWKVATGNIDLSGPNPFIVYPAYDGNQAVDLNGFVRGSLYQDFPTVLGQHYSLNFAYADNPLEGGVKSAGVTVTDLLSSATLLATSVSHSTSTNSPPNGDWIVYSGTFTATGTSTRLLFASTSASNSPSGGIILDDVELVALQPATYRTGTNGTNWADSGNWSGVVPGATAGTTNTDTALFNQNAPHSPLAIDADRNLQNITFDTANANSLTVGTIGGQALLLTAGGTIHTTSTVANAQTVNARLVLEGDYTFTSGAASSSATLSFGGGITPGATSGTTMLTLNGGNTGANTISGILADNSAGRLAVTESGTGVWILSGANTYSGDTTVATGTLKFNITSGTPTIAAGVTATVASGATLELAGSVSALGTAGGNRVHLVNNSTASGVVVSGTNQVVGGIDGLGNTQVNAGSDLTANHIIQSALIIGGTTVNPGLVTIDASDVSGNPLIVFPAGLLGELSSPSSSSEFVASVSSSARLSRIAETDLTVMLSGNSLGGGNPSSVPEPSTLLLVLLVITGLIGQRSALRRRARRDGY